MVIILLMSSSVDEDFKMHEKQARDRENSKMTACTKITTVPYVQYNKLVLWKSWEGWCKNNSVCQFLVRTIIFGMQK